MRASTNVKVSPDGRRATKTKGHHDWGNAACISEAACDAVAVRVIASKDGCIMVGFIHADDFAADDQIYDKPRACMLWCDTAGTLYGSGKKGAAYHNECIPIGSTVRCVRDRAARTVAFTIDGHCPGVAFADVPDGDLFFVCTHFTENDCVEIAA